MKTMHFVMRTFLEARNTFVKIQFQTACIFGRFIVLGLNNSQRAWAPKRPTPSLEAAQRLEASELPCTTSAERIAKEQPRDSFVCVFQQEIGRIMVKTKFGRLIKSMYGT